MSEHKTFSDNITSDSFWLKSLFMLLFVVIYSISEALVYLLTIVQWLHLLFTGRTQSDLAKFGAGLALYLAQLVSYLTTEQQQKPFPFSNWPVAETDER